MMRIIIRADSVWITHKCDIYTRNSVLVYCRFKGMNLRRINIQMYSEDVFHILINH